MYNYDEEIIEGNDLQEYIEESLIILHAWLGGEQVDDKSIMKAIDDIKDIIGGLDIQRDTILYRAIIPKEHHNIEDLKNNILKVYYASKTISSWSGSMKGVEHFIEHNKIHNSPDIFIISANISKYDILLSIEDLYHGLIKLKKMFMKQDTRYLMDALTIVSLYRDEDEYIVYTEDEVKVMDVIPYRKSK